MKKRLSQYLVTYSVHREESYRITAFSADEAKDMAFSEGVLIDTGETTDVIPFECEMEEPVCVEAP
jgi:hypothetical protein